MLHASGLLTHVNAAIVCNTGRGDSIGSATISPERLTATVRNAGVELTSLNDEFVGISHIGSQADYRRDPGTCYLRQPVNAFRNRSRTGRASVMDLSPADNFSARHAGDGSGNGTA